MNYAATMSDTDLATVVMCEDIARVFGWTFHRGVTTTLDTRHEVLSEEPEFGLEYLMLLHRAFTECTTV